MKTSRYILRRAIQLGRFLSLQLKRAYEFVSGLLHTGEQEVPEQEEPVTTPITFAVSEPLTLDSIPGASALSENLRDLVECRLEDIRESEGKAIEHAGLIVDFLDEIMHLLPNAVPTDAEVMTRLQDKLKETLKHDGGELLYFEVWTPEYQRAVEVTRCLPHDSPTILYAHRAYGFKLNGRLIRKQEVSIQAPNS